jgi:hypothetical protein
MRKFKFKNAPLPESIHPWRFVASGHQFSYHSHTPSVRISMHIFHHPYHARATHTTHTHLATHPSYSPSGRASGADARPAHATTFAPFALFAPLRALPDDADDLDIFAVGAVDGFGRRDGRRDAGMARGDAMRERAFECGGVHAR